MENQEIDKIKSKLPHGSYAIIASMLPLDGKQYKARTIEAMFLKRRTMKPEVLSTAKRFLETINVSF